MRVPSAHKNVGGKHSHAKPPIHNLTACATDCGYPLAAKIVFWVPCDTIEAQSTNNRTLQLALILDPLCFSFSLQEIMQHTSIVQVPAGVHPKMFCHLPSTFAE